MVFFFFSFFPVIKGNIDKVIELSIIMAKCTLNMVFFFFLLKRINKYGFFFFFRIV